MMISNCKKSFGLHALYKNMSALYGLNKDNGVFVELKGRGRGAMARAHASRFQTPPKFHEPVPAVWAHSNVDF